MVIEQARQYLRNLAPHVRERETAKILAAVTEEAEQMRKLLGGEDDISQALIDEHELTLDIIAAAKNLIEQKGRHNTEIAYKRLEDALKTPNVEVRGAARGGMRRRAAAFSASPRLPG